MKAKLINPITFGIIAAFFMTFNMGYTAINELSTTGQLYPTIFATVFILSGLLILALNIMPLFNRENIDVLLTISFGFLILGVCFFYSAVFTEYFNMV